ncbi:MAG: hypothetical protein NC930_07295, partial [Candidatus Omnitrophica bacterium]|nr:hypothetical protein [Candidatus Omnitrophota bacterium]
QSLRDEVGPEWLWKEWGDQIWGYESLKIQGKQGFNPDCSQNGLLSSYGMRLLIRRPKIPLSWI